ncbi:MAG TPA: hypothetical protein VLG27_03220 [Candidatus Saccharimonadia bacterium]|nr:hypothetical protein [Candidatus Saccharimonadia bacterium]
MRQATQARLPALSSEVQPATSNEAVETPGNVIDIATRLPVGPESNLDIDLQAEQIKAAQEELLSRLTPHQVRICRLMAEGMSHKEIAAELEMNLRTVSDNSSLVLKAVGITRRAKYPLIRLMNAGVSRSVDVTALGKLTKNELSVIDVMLKGTYDDASISKAETISLSARTLACHTLPDICKKLGIANRYSLIAHLDSIGAALGRHEGANPLAVYIPKTDFTKDARGQIINPDPESPRLYGQRTLLRMVIHKMCRAEEDNGEPIPFGAEFNLASDVLERLHGLELVDKKTVKKGRVDLAGLVLSELVNHRLFGKMLLNDKMRPAVLREVKKIAR